MAQEKQACADCGADYDDPLSTICNDCKITGAEWFWNLWRQEEATRNELPA